jgi:ligand-binding sensor domain-containing protein
LGRFERGEWTRFDTSSGLVNAHVRCLLGVADGSGAIWVGTYGGGLTRFENGRWTVFDATSGALPNNRVMCLHEMRTADGTISLWAGTYGGGLAKLERGEWTAFD